MHRARGPQPMPRRRAGERDEVAARQVLERERAGAAALDEPVRRDDVAVPRGRERVVLAPESRERIMGLHVGVRNLQRNAAFAIVERVPDFGAAAGADPLHEPPAGGRE